MWVYKSLNVGVFVDLYTRGMHSHVCKRSCSAHISNDQATAMFALVDSIDDGPFSYIMSMCMHLVHFRVRASFCM